MEQRDPVLLQLLEAVLDPEVPALDIVEMGIVREVFRRDGGTVVRITPTYSGCPALDVISEEISRTLEAAGYAPVEVEIVHTPAWSTELMTESAKAKLHAYGIAPPLGAETALVSLPRVAQEIVCPHCGTKGAAETVSEFGATACKALLRCTACREPFEYFKAH